MSQQCTTNSWNCPRQHPMDVVTVHYGLYHLHHRMQINPTENKKTVNNNYYYYCK